MTRTRGVWRGKCDLRMEEARGERKGRCSRFHSLSISIEDILQEDNGRGKIKVLARDFRPGLARGLKSINFSSTLSHLS